MRFDHRVHAFSCLRKWYCRYGNKWAFPSQSQSAIVKFVPDGLRSEAMMICVSGVTLLLAGCIPLTAAVQMQNSTASGTAKTSSAAHVPTLASILDSQLSLLESQFIPAAEAMPENEYSFAPEGPNFTGVRSFALEVRHVATANMGFYSAVLGQAPPAGVDLSGVSNGPDSLQTKDQIVQYLKDSFALGHKAMATLTAENAITPMTKPLIPSMNTRLALATFCVAHAWDHYGQMVEYLRMNGITPPASNGQPSANPSKR